MPSKKRVTTSAPKAKLPLPKGHPQVARPKKRKPPIRANKNVKAEGPEWDALKTKKHGIPLDAFPARAIPCGEDTTTLVAYPNMRATFVPSAEGTYRSTGFAPHPNADIPILRGDDILLPPDTSAYPWPLKFAWRVDGWIVTARTALASTLTRLAEKVKP